MFDHSLVFIADKSHSRFVTEMAQLPELTVYNNVNKGLIRAML